MTRPQAFQVFPWLITDETLYVRLTPQNGLRRIRNGEPELQVIRGGWVVKLARAKKVRRLIVLNPDGTIRRVLRVSLAHHAYESSSPEKRPQPRAWFDIRDDHQAASLIGTRSPVIPARNPVKYG
ncbi:hypothetical protein OVA21_00510 [Dietzia sp. SL131]|jgi:hypothetical protein|uniref:hypothetical protein n=1 Tax=Dietzia sp. SL131 TaxID=2995149 RepID=UPI0011BF72F2|nr:hypothetical protein [Dietzia sp. SL131]MCY1655726.1 hypothetical protein [Dietzia sp. SL131]